MTNGQEGYEAERVMKALAEDPRTSAPELTVRIGAGIVHVDGVVATEERRAAVDEVVGEVCPGSPIDNRTTVARLDPETDVEVLP